ncbi:hypothetical protein [Filobacillus milosensis]|uniref:hypothetical protein n=1 Tax=Filobacillus milosensis TaxID=94137 RepID=UPI00129BA01E|nr:hypothetical protein [Filobacillus milosensis]
MNFSGKKMVLLIIIVIAIMAVVTWAIFNFMDRNNYIEEMGLQYLGTILNQRSV